MTELVLLGSGGWIPTSERETCCAMLRQGSELLVIDAGTGLRRLVTDQGILAGVERVTILLTHFHLDHTAGLTYVPAFAERVRCEVVGPGEPVYGVPTREILGRLLGSPLFPLPPERIFADVRDLPRAGLRIGGLDIAWRRQERHTDPTVGYRIGNAYAYCTDTAYDEATADFARGTAVLLHEANYGGASTPDTTHSAAGDAARVAREAEVERLILIHRTPQVLRDSDLLEPARAVFAAAEAGADLQRITA